MSIQKSPIPVTLRPIVEGDEGKIAEFFDRMGPESRALFNRRDYNRRGVLKFCAKGDATRRYFAAVGEDGRMAGYVFFLDAQTSIPELGLAVRDDLQGRGLGRYLVEYAIEYAKAEGKGGLLLTTHVANLRAQCLYESCGFVCRGLCKNGSELFYLLRF